MRRKEEHTFYFFIQLRSKIKDKVIQNGISGVYYKSMKENNLSVSKWKPHFVVAVVVVVVVVIVVVVVVLLLLLPPPPLFFFKRNHLNMVPSLEHLFRQKKRDELKVH